MEEEVNWIKERIKKGIPKDEIKELFYNAFAGYNFKRFEDIFEKALLTYTDKVPEQPKEVEVEKKDYKRTIEIFQDCFKLSKPETCGEFTKFLMKKWVEKR